MKNLIVLLIIFGLISPIFNLSQAKEQPLKTPETLEEVKELGEETLRVGWKKLPGEIKKIWKESVIPVWEKMYNWFKENIWPKINNWLKKEAEPRIRGEVEKRKEIAAEEFEKEKEQIKKEAPEIGKSLWEKFKELIK